MLETEPGAWNPREHNAFFEALIIPGGPHSMIFVSTEGAGNLSVMTCDVT